MIDRKIVANFIRDTARALILPRFRALGSGDIREKKPGDPVTIADIETEQALTRLLTGVVPGALVLGEESVAEDTSRLEMLASDAPVWIIDPVDGTSNFAKGLPGFAVIVALAQRGEVEAGWIYDPLGDIMISSRKGEGAWLDDTRLAVSADVPPERITGSAYGRAKSGERAAKALNESGRIRGVHNQGCSGLEYMALARGINQFSLHSRSLPWDHAAGMLIVRESGGHASFLDGSGYDARIIDRPVLAAASAASWQVIHDIVVTS
jgi:fructose-1,6-bisphosphatase/inositol monophosphatase family enzyme